MVTVGDKVSEIIASKCGVLTYLKAQRLFPPEPVSNLQFSRISRHRTVKNMRNWSLKHCIVLGSNGIIEFKYHRI